MSDPHDESRITRFAASMSLRVEFTVYAALAALLALTAVLALFSASGTLWGSIIHVGEASGLLDSVNRLLLVLMIVEILHTVRVSMRSGILSGEPFLIVGLIASIRRILVITLQSSEVMHGGGWSEEREMAFRASMIELGVLGFLILTMVISIFLLRRARASEGESAAEYPAAP